MEYQEKFKNSKIKGNKIIQLLSDIIGFFNREQKPQWRQHFDRKDLSNSELIEEGTHDQLLCQGGTYANLYNLQFSEKNH